MTDDRLHDLVTRYYHGDLSAEELAELSVALRESPAARDRFAELAVLEAGLAEHYPRRVTVSAPPARRRWWPAAAVSAAAAVLLAAAGWWALRPAPVGPAAPVAAAAEVETRHGVVLSGAAGRPVDPGTRIAPGQTVSTVGFGSGVTLRYPDGTRLVLAGDTSITLTGGGGVRVDRGNLSANVPGDPMTITTPEAAVEAGHAVLAVARTTHQTQVGVIEGTARVSDPAGTRLLDMAGGEHGTVAADGTARKDRTTRPGDEYRWHTDRPLPRGWELGHLAVGADGPVLAPDLWDDPHIHRRCWQIRSENGWTRGLFLMHPDTRVRVRYKVDRPGEGQLLVVVRSDPPTPRVTNVMLAPVVFDPAPDGGWRTAELLTRDWVREEKPGRPVWDLPLPWTAFLVVFNTYEADLGLQVAELTVTRGPAPEPAP